VAAHPERIGKYEILAEIGRGGMGTVYRAKDPLLDRLVALKTISPEVVSEPGMRERFLREARSAARLQHPNIVTIYEFGEVEGLAFIAMELLAGGDLVEAVESGRLPDLASRLAVVIQMCDGLAYAHKHGVVHRDVKPSNISLLPDGVVKIVDFGIARLEGGTMATRTGEVLGTPCYMAPEQFAGLAVDHRVDIWSVGVILYELLAGHRPFDGGTVPSLIYQILNNPPPSIDARAGRMPPRLLGIVEHALAKEPRTRYPDLETMSRALRDVRAEVVASASGVASGPGSAPFGTATAITAAGAGFVVGPAASAPEAVTLSAPVRRTPTGRQTAFVGDGTFGEARKLRTIALSPDETLLAAGGSDGSIRLWDLGTREKLATLRNREHMRSGHGSLTTSLAFSDDGALLASGHLDGAIYLWEIATGLELDVRMAHDGAVGGLGIPPGGRTLISGGADATLKFWDLEAARKGDARSELRRQPDAVLCLALAGQGRQVVTGHESRSLRVHDTSDHRLVATFHGHRAPLSALAISPAGDLVASGARDGFIRVHHLATRGERGFHHEHTRAVASMAFFPGGQRLASVAMDGSVVVWDMNEPELPVTLTGSPDESFSSICATRDGRRLLCASTEGRIRVWLCQV
jgi:eukaryotic-like serine/threonine-protein kinase